MPCFVCAKCECIENTALSNYWMHKRIEIYKWPEELEPYKGMPLCSECGPVEFTDGSKAGNGRWHGRFEKKHWSESFEIKPEGMI